jgi:hypothetical protein
MCMRKSSSSLLSLNKPHLPWKSLSCPPPPLWIKAEAARQRRWANGPRGAWCSVDPPPASSLRLLCVVCGRESSIRNCPLPLLFICEPHVKHTFTDAQGKNPRLLRSTYPRKSWKDTCSHTPELSCAFDFPVHTKTRHTCAPPQKNDTRKRETNHAHTRTHSHTRARTHTHTHNIDRR